MGNRINYTLSVELPDNVNPPEDFQEALRVKLLDVLHSTMLSQRFDPIDISDIDVVNKESAIIIPISGLNQKPGSDHYYITTVFMRSHGDDDELIQQLMEKNSIPEHEATTLQFVRELQEAYDDSGMAGHFQVQSVVLRDKIYPVRLDRLNRTTLF